MLVHQLALQVFGLVVVRGGFDQHLDGLFCVHVRVPFSFFLTLYIGGSEAARLQDGVQASGSSAAGGWISMPSFSSRR